MLVGYLGTNFFKRCATGQMPWQMSKLILIFAVHLSNSVYFVLLWLIFSRFPT